MKRDWPALLFGEGGAVIRSLEALSARRFPGDRELADTAFNHALGVLTTDDYARLNRFRGDSHPKTFLIACFRNALEDFARSKFGKCLPPTWLRSLGTVYVTVHRRLCCEHQSTRSVIDDVGAVGGIDEPELRAIVGRVLERVPSCFRHSNVPPRSVAFDEAVETAVGSQPAPGERADDELLTAVLAFVVRDAETGVDAQVLERLRDLRERVLPGLDLTDTQKTLIRLVAVGHTPLSQASRTVGLNYHTARRQLMAGLERLKAAFAESCLTPEQFE